MILLSIKVVRRILIITLVIILEIILRVTLRVRITITISLRRILIRIISLVKSALGVIVASLYPRPTLFISLRR